MSKRRRYEAGALRLQTPRYQRLSVMWTRGCWGAAHSGDATLRAGVKDLRWQERGKGKGMFTGGLRGAEILAQDGIGKGIVDIQPLFTSLCSTRTKRVGTRVHPCMAPHGVTRADAEDLDKIQPPLWCHARLARLGCHGSIVLRMPSTMCTPP